MVAAMEDQAEESIAKSDGLRAKVAEKTRGIGTAVVERIDDRREKVAGMIDEAAESLNQHALHAKSGQQAAERKLADGMEATADYLHSHPAGEVARDLMESVRRHPLRSLLLALGAGYLLARILR
jgi:hypothetical protein